MKLFYVHLALFIVTLLYAFNFVIAKFVTPAYVLPFGIVILRVWGCTFLFWMLQLFIKREKIRSRKDYLQLFYCAIFGVCANQLLFFKGISLATPINVSIMMTLSPLIVLVVAAIVLGEVLTSRKVLGVLLGATGAFLLIGGFQVTFESESSLGELFILLNATSYAIYLVLVKPLMQKYSSLTVVTWIFTFGCLMVLPAGLGQLMIVDWSSQPAFVYWILTYIVLGATFTVYLLNAWGLRYVNASVVGFYIYLQPVLTSMIAVSMGQDELTWEKVLFSSLIFMGVYLVSVGNEKKKKNTLVVNESK